VEKAKIHVDNEPINNEDENDQFNSSVFDNSNQPNITIFANKVIKR
jgi:hypothetical protein